MPYRPARAWAVTTPAGHDQRRQGGGAHAHRQAGDQVGGVARARGPGDPLHRLETGVRVIDRDPGQPQRHAQPAQGGAEQGGHGVGGDAVHEPRRHGVIPRHRQQGADGHAPGQGADHRFPAGQAHGRHAGHGADQPDGAEGQGVVSGGERVRHGPGGDQDDRQQGDRVTLEQVGGHAGAVPHVVPHVVGDGGGVARVILGDAVLDLAHQVGTHVRRLGEDAAAEPAEDTDQRGAEAQAEQGLEVHRPTGH